MRNIQRKHKTVNRKLLCLVTPPLGWLGPDVKAFSSFTALLPYANSRFATIWVKPRLASLPTPRDNIRLFLQKLRDMTSVNAQIKIIQKGSIILEPSVPYTEFYVSVIRKYDNFYIRYWSIIAKIIAHRVEDVLNSLNIKLCLSTHIFGGLLGSILKEMNLIKYHVYYDLDKFSTIPPFDKELSTQISYLENKIVKKADMVWSVSSTLAKIREGKGARKVLIVPHGVNKSLFAKAVNLRNSLIADGLKGPFSIVYTGTIHPNWGVDILLKAFDLLMKKSYDIKLILAGPATHSLLKYIKELEHKYPANIQYLGIIHWSELYKILALGDVGVAPYKGQGSARYGTPLKIKEYIAAGLPVISTSIGEIQHFLKENGVGITCECSAHELANAIITLIENPQLKEEMEKNTLQSKLFSWKQVFDFAFKKTFEILEN